MNESEQNSALIKLANQGEVKAILDLLRQAFADREITVKVSLSSTCLRILLESDRVPDSDVAIAVIQETLQHLNRDRIQSVQVSGRVTEVSQTAWTETLALAAPSTAPIHNVLGRVEKKAPRSLTRSIDSKGLGALLSGFILAIVLMIVSPFRLLFHGFIILVHEVGHAVAHWLFGRPAIPTVNILYGGGVTLTFEQSTILVCLIYLAIAFLAYYCRYYRFILVVLGFFTSVYSFCLSNSTNLMLSTFMGHGMELVAIAVCLYLSMSGYFCRFAGDRSIYSMLGFFTLFADVDFSWKLTHDLDYRELYEGGIGGVIDNDFVILARDYFNVNLSVVANNFLIGCLVIPIAMFLVFRYEFWLRQWLDRLLRY